MSKETRYVNADLLISQIYQIHFYPGLPYTSDVLGQAINGILSQALSSAFESWKSSLAVAIEKSSLDYSPCMLCTRRDGDVKPPHPLGDW